MAGESEVLVPVERDTISFYTHPLVAVRLADGRIGVVLRWLCDGLQLEPTAQIRRIRRTEAIAEELLSVRVNTEGGAQVMPALTLRALPFWLAGITPARVAEELRPVILAYQREVVDTLYQHFSQRPSQLTAPPTLVPSEPITQPERPPQDAPALAQAEYHEAMAVWLRWRVDIEAWQQRTDQRQTALEQRMDSAEGMLHLVPELLERLGPQTLSPEHQHTIQSGVKRLHELTGRAYGTLWTELGASFHVAKYDQIPESRWEEVAEWLRTRITRAGGQAPEQGSLF